MFAAPRGFIPSHQPAGELSCVCVCGCQKMVIDGTPTCLAVLSMPEGVWRAGVAGGGGAEEVCVGVGGYGVLSHANALPLSLARPGKAEASAGLCVRKIK